jgi:hypothetical protein
MKKNMAEADWKRFNKRTDLNRIINDRGTLDPEKETQRDLLHGWFRDPKVKQSRLAARRGKKQADTSNFYDCAGLD